jgi:hypothetical protein
VTDRVNRVVDRRSIPRPQSHNSASEKALFQDFGVERPLSLKHDPRPRVQFLPRMNQRLPTFSSAPSLLRPSSVPAAPLPPQTPDQQALDRAAARYPPPEKSRGKDAGVVDDQEIARAQKIRERSNGRMRNCSGLAIQVQKPRSSPIRRRRLRNQVGRKREVKIADIHRLPS